MSYKIALITDCHLGYSSGQIYENGINLRTLDGYRAWHEAVDQMIEAKPDVFLMGGDIFHQAHPSIRTIEEAQKGFRKLADSGIPVYCIVGNHDATDVRSEIPASGVLDEPYHNIHSFVEPYVKVEVAPGIFVHCLSHHPYKDQEKTMKKIHLEKDAINILLSHGSCYDTNMNTILHCAQEPREVVLPEKLINMGWDYTFLGHIHERGFIGSNDGGVTDTAGRKQFYGGSILRRGFTDNADKLGRGWTLWEIDDDNKFTPTFYDVWQRPQFDLPTIDTDNLSASEIEEKLVDQLKELCDKLGTITNENTPIVRQTIKNIIPAKYVAINWKRIMQYGKQFMTYSLRRQDKIIMEDDTDIDDKDIKQLSQEQNIVKVFDKWADESNSVKEIEDKDEVLDNTREWLHKGQESVLDKDN